MSAIPYPDAAFAGVKNGRLLSLAEGAGFEVFVAMDKGLPYQQNLAGRRIAILVIRARSNRLIDILPHIEVYRSEMSVLTPGSVVVIGG